MGVVFKAEDRAWTLRALSFCGGSSARPSGAGAVWREAKALRPLTIQHLHIYDIGGRWRAFIAMEFRRNTLRTRLPAIRWSSTLCFRWHRDCRWLDARTPRTSSQGYQASQLFVTDRGTPRFWILDWQVRRRDSSAGVTQATVESDHLTAGNGVGRSLYVSTGRGKELDRAPTVFLRPFCTRWNGTLPSGRFVATCLTRFFTDTRRRYAESDVQRSLKTSSTRRWKKTGMHISTHPTCGRI